MEGFKPIYSENSKILILGSFPSIKSRDLGFYYGNGRNRFWKLIGELFNVKIDDINSKKSAILKNNLALWDIVANCEIQGSLDKNLKNIKCVDLSVVLYPNTKVNKILCNGKKSFDLTMKYLSQNGIKIECVCMPSTSPANVRFNKEIWKKELEVK